MQYSHSLEHVFLQMRSSLESTILIWNMQYHTVQCCFRTTSFRTVPHKGAEFLAKYGIYCAAFLWDSIIYIYMYKETVFLQNLQYSFQVLLIVRNPWKSAFPQPPALFLSFPSIHQHRNSALTVSRMTSVPLTNPRGVSQSRIKRAKKWGDDVRCTKSDILKGFWWRCHPQTLQWWTPT